MSYIDLQFTTIQEKTPWFIYDELKEFIPSCNSYSPQPPFLREKLAQDLGVPADWIFLTNGVDEAIRVAIEACGQNAHIFTPTEYTTFYQFCESVNVHASLDGLTYAISTETVPKATLFWLANPNNPVGLTTVEDVLALTVTNPDAMVIVDEIYGEFAPHLSVLPYVQMHKNLVVCKGFSKSFGLPGIRLGYMVGHPSLLERFSTRAPWANVSYLSCAVAAIALDHRDYYESLRTRVLRRRQNLVELIEGRDITVVPSLINTITLQLPTDEQAREVVRTFAENGVLVNHGDGGGKVGIGDRYVSFAVGTEQQIRWVSDVVRHQLQL